jgi:hypothetical protein
MPAMGEFLGRWVEMVVGRLDGPFALRFILQPVTAAVIAFRAGCRDARSGRPVYCWAVITNRADRRNLLREGWRELSRVFLLAVLIDLIYELVVFRWVYPGQALVVAAVLALLPYPLIRGVVNHVVCRWRRAHPRCRGPWQPVSRLH